MPRGIKIFGKKLAAARREKMLNQPTLARLAEMSIENVKRLERAEVTATDREKIPRIAAALQMPLEEFQAKIVAEGKSDVVAVYLRREVFDSIAARAAHEGHGTNVAAFLEATAVTIPTIIVRPLDGDGTGTTAKGKDPPKPRDTGGVTKRSSGGSASSRGTHAAPARKTVR